MKSTDYTKKLNREAAVVAKLELRRKALDSARPVHVFDAFYGPDGVMWGDARRGARRATSGAASSGCRLTSGGASWARRRG